MKKFRKIRFNESELERGKKDGKECKVSNGVVRIFWRIIRK